MGGSSGRTVLAIAMCIAAMSYFAQADADGIDYTRDIQPLLNSRCYACHGALKQEAGLRLDTGDLIRQGGESGAAVSIVQPDSSLILQRVSATDLSVRMPPEGEPLTASEIEALRDWIRLGALSPEDEQPETDPSEHWAFQPPQRAELPTVDGNLTSHPIDAFLNEELARRGLTARPAASKAILLRRVYLDLIGLPPTPDELRAFVEDESADAYERVVDRLLNDQRHGERWGRHWMDIWRYSDWYGRRYVNDVRNSASQMFRWRDWIVQSLNDGKSYDRMVQEMLAADEICPEDYDASVATGYLIRNYYSLNANDWMRSTVEHTGKAFLGLTFHCAHCHDHKYDPILQTDYFQLRAFFEPMYIRQDRVPGEADPGPFEDYTYAGSRTVVRLGAVRVFDKVPDAPTWFYTGGDERNRLTDRGSVPPGVPAFLQPETLRVDPVTLPPRAWYPGLRPEIQETLLADARAAVATAETALAAEAQLAEVAKPAALVEAEATYTQLVEQAAQAGRPGALVGQQSLLLDATAGRRVLQNGMSSLQSLPDGVEFEFQLLILQDSHVNFQFIKDITQGATAGYVAFENGIIKSYQPGSVSEFQAGSYNVTGGQTRFHVQVVLQPAADRCLLSVRSLADDLLLIDSLPIALGGWNPIQDQNQVILFDARSGTVAAIDEVQLTVPATEGNPSEQFLSFDFEPPKYVDNADVVGIDGWVESSYSVAPATSVVSRTASNLELRDAATKLEAARRQFDAPLLRRRALEMQVIAASVELASVEARIAADRARYGEIQNVDVADMIRTASRTEREAALKRAELEVMMREVAFAEAEALSAEDANRAAAIADAASELEAARGSCDQARVALEDEQRAEIYTPLSPQFPQQSTGRRRALAEWITRRDNPLTARVAVNHIWTRHFQAPLVSSMYDFGRNGSQPTHPALLDRLAVEFMESGWNMKHLHRLIVTSQAYQRVSSIGDAQRNAAVDPENIYLWRMNSWRMEAEVVRDSLLFVAGRLDLTMGGVELENTEALTTFRRSLYYATYPEAGGKSPIGELFDAPDPLDCYRRVSSVIPQQALALTNSALVHEASVAIVQAWQSSQSAETSAEGETERFITSMFELVLSRPPTENEYQACLEILEQQRQLAADIDATDAVIQSRQSLVRVLLNHNDFLTVR